jgi:hypothetical protein
MPTANIANKANSATLPRWDRKRPRNKFRESLWIKRADGDRIPNLEQLSYAKAANAKRHQERVYPILDVYEEYVVKHRCEPLLNEWARLAHAHTRTVKKVIQDVIFLARFHLLVKKGYLTVHASQFLKASRTRPLLIKPPLLDESSSLEKSRLACFENECMQQKDLETRILERKREEAEIWLSEQKAKREEHEYFTSKDPEIVKKREAADRRAHERDLEIIAQYKREIEERNRKRMEEKQNGLELHSAGRETHDCREGPVQDEKQTNSNAHSDGSSNKTRRPRSYYPPGYFKAANRNLRTPLFGLGSGAKRGDGESLRQCVAKQEGLRIESVRRGGTSSERTEPNGFQTRLVPLQVLPGKLQSFSKSSDSSAGDQSVSEDGKDRRDEWSIDAQGRRYRRGEDERVLPGLSEYDYGDIYEDNYRDEYQDDS